ncbi:MAG: chromosome segregation protein SMC [Alphaproteobacteria bacterium]|nr:chromosome segregation protein SMC [Alphaproteobacteria bacterium]
MQFTKLKLTGFKSFVESAEFVIESGMTGIVGPNGCGKSNLVEALRWVMGETSAKQMRGGEMDDVIFSGTDQRAARNVAEVAVWLDNSTRKAPAAFNESDAIEVVRRIERGEGSAYRVNGREVRARDVQLLFADAASGAHSSAMVGQGRINDIINAKPAQRRIILEEAAGVTGLHARRHEAELKLKAAETNLLRIDDVLGALESQLQGLKRQVRQASRYRRLSESLRRLDALLLHLRWNNARQDAAEATQALDDANRIVATLTAEVAAATTAETEAGEALPALRQTEAELGAALHRLSVARDALEAEAQRLAEARFSFETRLAQIATDIEREQGLANDGAAALERIATEIALLDAAISAEAEAEAAAAAVRASAVETVRALDERLTRRLEEAAATEAKRSATERNVAALAERRRRIADERDAIERERAELVARASQDGERRGAASTVAAAADAVSKARLALDDGEQTRESAHATANAARDRVQAIEAGLARLKAERDALDSVLGKREPGYGPSVVDVITVEPGYEAALGAALGDDLDAPENEHAAIHWATLSPLIDPPALPEGAAPLSAVVGAPAALARRLSQVGVIEEVDGPRLRQALRPGQRLVTRSGAMWRWDGFTLGRDAPTTAATRLKQRNRLTALGAEIDIAQRERDEAATISDGIEIRRRVAEGDAASARYAADKARDLYQAALDRKAKLDAAAAADASRLEALGEAAERLATDIHQTSFAETEAEAALAAMPPSDQGRAETARLRDELVAARTTLDEKARAHDQVLRERATREARLRSLAEDHASWTQRTAGTARRLAELEGRRVDADAGLRAILGKPDEIAAKRNDLLNEIAALEARRRDAADALARGDANYTSCGCTRRSAEQALSSSREDRVRLESRLEHAKTEEASAVAQIRERFECAPDQALSHADPEPAEALPELAQVEERIHKLNREREAIGPVNLRAELEARELEEQIESLSREKTDLEAAIARLRQGITSLNREGRERVLVAFVAINRHFQVLFTKLFGGGNAHLILVDSDDPLQAGLEIMASPPGKRLQSLSLLSGGEKALTALALLFGAFLTNPAPICVLDEADAPLDESNVGRFCELIEDLAIQAQTRFIVITHNRITMARVDRLYGVTMAERGVSQLVSVDLDAAERLRETA